ncbi:hypothetical protein [Glaesserella parasuis]|nr:hypothetical protein [Glaesserella parasuis]MCT8813796.1 hypothetical protein [Glaesserella parasuis]MDE4033258.1 hypothetical protein [Glaesserella parasuis]MDO9891769.1 hypothetical protein [Glaesserella parasuis]MWQ15347.1 hypothetical protein [Glaesserella parasuis]
MNGEKWEVGFRFWKDYFSGCLKTQFANKKHRLSFKNGAFALLPLLF